MLTYALNSGTVLTCAPYRGTAVRYRTGLVLEPPWLRIPPRIPLRKRGASIDSVPGLSQKRFKNDLRHRCLKALKNDPWASKIDSKIFENRDRGGLHLVFPMLFLRTLILKDFCMNSMFFQVLGKPRITKKPSKPSPRNIRKLYVAIAASRSSFE